MLSLACLVTSLCVYGWTGADLHWLNVGLAWLALAWLSASLGCRVCWLVIGIGQSVGWLVGCVCLWFVGEWFVCCGFSNKWRLVRSMH